MPMPSDSAKTPTLTIKRTISGSPEEIFDLWTLPSLMAKWMSPYAGEVQCVAASDVRVGGAFHLLMQAGASRCEITGTYLEVRHPTRLVFTWIGPPTASATTRVTVELRAIGGSTELSVTHAQLPTDEVRDGHARGWANMLDHLTAALGAS
jgi:uncharacterized protein YndB with AHSA1/START domain